MKKPILVVPYRINPDTNFYEIRIHPILWENFQSALQRGVTEEIEWKEENPRI